MASLARKFKARKKLKEHNMGRARKNAMGRKSTPSKAELFGPAPTEEKK